MRIQPCIVLAGAAYAFCTAPVLAKSNKSTQTNGEPFQEIHAIIAENRALITANQASVADLQAVVAGISALISDLDVDLSEIDSRLSANESDIAALQASLADLGADISALNVALDGLRADHDTDIAVINAAIVDAQTRIDDLETALVELSDMLNLQLSALETEVNNNTIAIDGLLLDLTATTAQAMANILAINLLEGRIDDLESRAASHEAGLAELRSQIDTLIAAVGTNEADIAFLTSLHFDPQCFESYNTLTAPSRNAAFNDGDDNIEICDAGTSGLVVSGPAAENDWQGPGWYRFMDDAGTQMPETAPAEFSCGTDAPGWLNGIHPVAADGIADRQVCFNWNGDSCNWSNQIEVVSCSDFFLYNLQNPPSVCLRHCGK